MLIIEPTQYPKIKHSLNVGDEVIDVVTGVSGRILNMDCADIIVRFSDMSFSIYHNDLLSYIVENILENESSKLHRGILKRKWMLCGKIKIKPKC